MKRNYILITFLYLLVTSIGALLLYVGIIDIQFVVVLSGIFGFIAICVLLGLVISEKTKDNH